MKPITAEALERQSSLYAALRKATSNTIAQYGLIRVYARRLGCTEGDVKAVKQLINASSERAR